MQTALILLNLNKTVLATNLLNSGPSLLQAVDPVVLNALVKNGL